MLYDVSSDQLVGAMDAIAEKLAVLEKEGLLRDGEREREGEGEGGREREKERGREGE